MSSGGKGTPSEYLKSCDELRCTSTTRTARVLYITPCHHLLCGCYHNVLISCMAAQRFPKRSFQCVQQHPVCNPPHVHLGFVCICLCFRTADDESPAARPSCACAPASRSCTSHHHLLGCTVYARICNEPNRCSSATPKPPRTQKNNNTIQNRTVQSSPVQYSLFVLPIEVRQRHVRVASVE